jgi:hypothetical protein
MKIIFKLEGETKMKKGNGFKLGITLLAILIFVGGYFTFNKLAGGQKGDKTIVITIKDESTNKTLVDNKKYNTDAANLGDFLEQYKDELGVDLQASKYGRFIAGVKGIKTEDMNKGPWWMLGYKSPSQNIDMKVGEAPGADNLPLYDKDEVILVFTSNMNVGK